RQETAITLFSEHKKGDDMTGPVKDDALYFGFQNDLSNRLLSLELDFEYNQARGFVSVPPYVWEASTGKEGQPWAACEVEEDSTRGMNQAGRITLHLPPMDAYALTEGAEPLYWVRARIEHTSKDAD